MARDVTLGIHGDLRPLIKDIDKLTKKKYTLDFRTKGDMARPLGNISGQLGEFEKSLEASNARVLAFSASAGALYAFQRGVEAIFSSAVDLEKQLADINVILNISSKNLNKFGNDLYFVAKNTAQGFTAVATAATELARQGLSVEETLKRTTDALILTRLSGMDTVASVEALTAALNSFSRAAMDSSVFVSKLAAVDAAFAVSSADLAEAVKRVGSSAQEAGLNIDELIASVTAAQQITARGGAVIGNSFKTIFTRIQRPRVLKQLEELGIRTTDLAGKVRPAMQVLQDLASTYDVLTDAQKAQITQLVGGVFQVNVLKASLRDLGKEFSLYKNALDISSNATDEATRRNEELNKTVSATLNKTIVNLQKTAAAMGELSFGPVTRSVSGFVNKMLESVSIKDGEGIGEKLGEGMMKGLGVFLKGGGLAIAAVTLVKVFSRMTTQISDAFKTLTGMGAKSKDRLLLEKQITNQLAENPYLIEKIKKGELSIVQVHKSLLNQIELENKAMLLQKRIAEQIASALLKKGVKVGDTLGELIPPGGEALIPDVPGMASRKGGHVPRKSKGHIPNYSVRGDRKRQKMAKVQELREASYAKSSTRAVMDRMPGLGAYVRNTAEEKISGKVTGHKQDWINPPRQSIEGRQHRKSAIRQTGIDPYALKKGMVPNFAKIIDWDKIHAKQYAAMMNHALSGGHQGPILNVIGPGGSGKNYFAENMVSRRRTKAGKPLKEKAKGYLHRVKEAAGAVVGEIPLVGQHLEKGMRGHHDHKKKGGSYAFSPQDVATNEAMIFLHSTPGPIKGARRGLFTSPRTQSNYLIARSKEEVEKLRDKRARTGMGAMGRKNLNVGTRDYKPLEEALKSIRVPITRIGGVGPGIGHGKGHVPNFLKTGQPWPKDITTSGKGPTLGSETLGPGGRKTWGHGFFDFSLSGRPVSAKTKVGRWEGDIVKDYEQQSKWALQTSNLYGDVGIGKKLKSMGYKSPKRDLTKMLAEGYMAIRNRTMGKYSGIFSDTTVSPFGAKVKGDLASLFPGRFMNVQSMVNPPVGTPRSVLRGEGAIPNFLQYQMGQKIPKGRGAGGRHVAVRDKNMNVYWDPKAAFHSQVVEKDNLEGKTMDGGWLFPSGNYEKIPGHDGSGLQAQGFVPNFKDFEKIKTLSATATWGELGNIFPSIKQNKMSVASGGKQKVRPLEAADLNDKFAAKISLWEHGKTHAQLKNSGIGAGSFENLLNKDLGGKTSEGISSGYPVDGIVSRSLANEAKFFPRISSGKMRTSEYYLGKMARHAYGSGVFPPNPKKDGKATSRSLGELRVGLPRGRAYEREPGTFAPNADLIKYGGYVPNFKELFSRVGSMQMYENVEDSFLPKMPIMGTTPGGGHGQVGSKRPSGVMLDYFNIPNKKWHGRKRLYTDDIADTEQHYPWAIKNIGAARGQGWADRKGASWDLHTNSLSLMSSVATPISSATKADFMETWFEKSTHRVGEMPARKESQKRGRHGGQGDKPKTGAHRKASKGSTTDAGRAGLRRPYSQAGVENLMKLRGEDPSYLKPGGMYFRGPKKDGHVPSFYDETAGHDPDHGRQMMLNIFKDKKSFKGGRGNVLASYRGTSMQLHKKVDSTSKDYLKQHKGKAWQIVDGPTLTHSSPNPPPGIVFDGMIPNFRKAVSIGTNQGGLVGAVSDPNDWSVREENLYKLYSKHPKSPLPTLAYYKKNTKDVSIGDEASLAAFARMGNVIKTDPESSQRALAGAVYSESANAAFMRKNISRWLGVNTAGGASEPVPSNMVNWWLHTNKGYNAWKEVMPSHDGMGGFPTGSPAGKLVKAGVDRKAGGGDTYRGHAFEDTLEEVLRDQGVNTSGAQGAMDFRNLNKVNKTFASAIGLRPYGEVHHGDAHIGSGHDVPHMLGKIIRDLTSDGGKVPYEDWQKMVEVGKGGATLKATLGTKKDAQEAGSAALKIHNRFVGEKVKVKKGDEISAQGQAIHDPNKDAGGRNITNEQGRNIKSSVQSLHDDPTRKQPNEWLPVQTAGYADLGKWLDTKGGGMGDYIEAFDMNKVRGNVGYTDMTQSVATDNRRFESTAAGVLRQTPSKFANLRKMIERGVISGNTPISGDYKKDQIDLIGGLSGLSEFAGQSVLDILQGSKDERINLRYAKDGGGKHRDAAAAAASRGKFSKGFIPSFIPEDADAKTLLNQFVDIKQGMNRGEKGVVKKVMADGRTLEVLLDPSKKYPKKKYPKGQTIFADKTLIGERLEQERSGLQQERWETGQRRADQFGRFSEGFIPNFANPLRDAISREAGAGISKSRIRVEQSSKLVGPQNPMGLAVTNTRDEPMGVEQGIRRAQGMGVDPKTHGIMARSGNIPNFARAIKGKAHKKVLRELEVALPKGAGEIAELYNQMAAHLREGNEQGAKKLSQDIIAMAQDSGVAADVLGRVKKHNTSLFKHSKDAEVASARRADAEEVAATAAEKEKGGLWGKISKKADDYAGKVESNALTLSFVIPQVTESFAAMGLGVSEKGNELVSGLGSAVSSATGLSGALSSLGVGAVGSLAVGGLLGIGSMLGSWEKAMHGVSKRMVVEAEKAKEGFTKLSNSLQQYASTFDELGKASESLETDPKVLVRLQRKLNKLMIDIPSEFRAQVLGITDPKELQERIAEVIENQTIINVQAEITGNIAKAFDEALGVLSFFGGGQRKKPGGVFREEAGAKLLTRVIDDLRKGIKFEKFSKAVGEAGYAARILAMDSGALAAEFKNAYGASENLAVIINKLNKNEFATFRAELMNSANAARFAATQLEELQVGRAESMEETGVRDMQRLVEVSKQMLELEKQTLKAIGGGVAGFQDTKNLDDTLKKFREGLATQAFTEPRGIQNIVRGRQGAARAEGLRRGGITPEIDFETGKIAGPFANLLQEVQHGIVENAQRMAENELHLTIAARDQALRQGNRISAGRLSEQIQSRLAALADPRTWRNAADEQSREMLGLPDLSKLRPGIKVPEGGKVRVGGVVKDQAAVSLEDLFKANSYNVTQQLKVLQDVARHLGKDVDYSKTALALQAAGVDEFRNVVNAEQQVKDFLADSNNLAQLSLGQLKGFRSVQDTALISQREFRAPSGETPAQAALRIAQDNLTIATTNLKDSIVALGQKLEKERVIKESESREGLLDPQMIVNALDENIRDLRLDVSGLSEDSNMLSQMWSQRPGLLGGDSVREMQEGLTDVKMKELLVGISQHLGEKMGISIREVVGDDRTYGDFNRALAGMADFQRLSTDQKSFLRAALMTLNEQKGQSAAIMSTLRQINQAAMNPVTRQLGGFVPNYANQMTGRQAIQSGMAPKGSPIRQALTRETAPRTGISMNQTRVNFAQGGGAVPNFLSAPPISVTNTRDEGASANPMIGVRRVAGMGGNPSLAGSGREFMRLGGEVPNYSIADLFRRIGMPFGSGGGYNMGRMIKQYPELADMLDETWFLGRTVRRGEKAPLEDGYRRFLDIVANEPPGSGRSFDDLIIEAFSDHTKGAPLGGVKLGNQKFADMVIADKSTMTLFDFFGDYSVGSGWGRTGKKLQGLDDIGGMKDEILQVVRIPPVFDDLTLGGKKVPDMAASLAMDPGFKLKVRDASGKTPTDPGYIETINPATIYKKRTTPRAGTDVLAYKDATGNIMYRPGSTTNPIPVAGGRGEGRTTLGQAVEDLRQAGKTKESGLLWHAGKKIGKNRNLLVGAGLIGAGAVSMVKWGADYDDKGETDWPMGGSSTPDGLPDIGLGTPPVRDTGLPTQKKPKQYYPEPPPLKSEWGKGKFISGTMVPNPQDATKTGGGGGKRTTFTPMRGRGFDHLGVGREEYAILNRKMWGLPRFQKGGYVPNYAVPQVDPATGWPKRPNQIPWTTDTLQEIFPLLGDQADTTLKNIMKMRYAAEHKIGDPGVIGTYYPHGGGNRFEGVEKPSKNIKFLRTESLPQYMQSLGVDIPKPGGQSFNAGDLATKIFHMSEATTLDDLRRGADIAQFGHLVDIDPVRTEMAHSAYTGRHYEFPMIGEEYPDPVRFRAHPRPDGGTSWSGVSRQKLINHPYYQKRLQTFAESAGITMAMPGGGSKSAHVFAERKAGGKGRLMKRPKRKARGVLGTQAVPLDSLEEKFLMKAAQDFSDKKRIELQNARTPKEQKVYRKMMEVNESEGYGSHWNRAYGDRGGFSGPITNEARWRTSALLQQYWNQTMGSQRGEDLIKKISLSSHGLTGADFSDVNERGGYKGIVGLVGSEKYTDSAVTGIRAAEPASAKHGHTAVAGRPMRAGRGEVEALGIGKRKIKGIENVEDVNRKLITLWSEVMGDSYSMLGHSKANDAKLQEFLTLREGMPVTEDLAKTQNILQRQRGDVGMPDTGIKSYWNKDEVNASRTKRALQQMDVLKGRPKLSRGGRGRKGIAGLFGGLATMKSGGTVPNFAEMSWEEIGLTLAGATMMGAGAAGLALGRNKLPQPHRGGYGKLFDKHGRDIPFSETVGRKKATLGRGILGGGKLKLGSERVGSGARGFDPSYGFSYSLDEFWDWRAMDRKTGNIIEGTAAKSDVRGGLKEMNKALEDAGLRPIQYRANNFSDVGIPEGRILNEFGAETKEQRLVGPRKRLALGDTSPVTGKPATAADVMNADMAIQRSWKTAETDRIARQLSPEARMRIITPDAITEPIEATLLSKQTPPGPIAPPTSKIPPAVGGDMLPLSRPVPSTTHLGELIFPSADGPKPAVHIGTAIEKPKPASSMAPDLRVRRPGRGGRGGRGGGIAGLAALLGGVGAANYKGGGMVPNFVNLPARSEAILLEALGPPPAGKSWGAYLDYLPNKPLQPMNIDEATGVPKPATGIGPARGAGEFDPYSMKIRIPKDYINTLKNPQAAQRYAGKAIREGTGVSEEARLRLEAGGGLTADEYLERILKTIRHETDHGKQYREAIEEYELQRGTKGRKSYLANTNAAMSRAQKIDPSIKWSDVIVQNLDGAWHIKAAPDMTMGQRAKNVLGFGLPPNVRAHSMLADAAKHSMGMMGMLSGQPEIENIQGIAERNAKARMESIFAPDGGFKYDANKQLTLGEPQRGWWNQVVNAGGDFWPDHYPQGQFWGEFEARMGDVFKTGEFEDLGKKLQRPMPVPTKRVVAGGEHPPRVKQGQVAVGPQFRTRRPAGARGKPRARKGIAGLFGGLAGLQSGGFVPNFQAAPPKAPGPKAPDFKAIDGIFNNIYKQLGFSPEQIAEIEKAAKDSAKADTKKRANQPYEGAPLGTFPYGDLVSDHIASRARQGYKDDPLRGFTEAPAPKNMNPFTGKSVVKEQPTPKYRSLFPSHHGFRMDEPDPFATAKPNAPASSKTMEILEDIELNKPRTSMEHMLRGMGHEEKEIKEYLDKIYTPERLRELYNRGLTPKQSGGFIPNFQDRGGVEGKIKEAKGVIGGLKNPLTGKPMKSNVLDWWAKASEEEKFARSRQTRMQNLKEKDLWPTDEERKNKTGKATKGSPFDQYNRLWGDENAKVRGERFWNSPEGKAILAQDKAGKGAVRKPSFVGEDPLGDTTKVVSHVKRTMELTRYQNRMAELYDQEKISGESLKQFKGADLEKYKKFFKGEPTPVGAERKDLLKGFEKLSPLKKASGGMIPNFELDADLERLIYSRADFSDQDDALKFLRKNLYDEKLTNEMIKSLAYGGGGRPGEALEHTRIKPLGSSTIVAASVGETLAGKFDPTVVMRSKTLRRGDVPASAPRLRAGMSIMDAIESSGGRLPPMPSSALPAIGMSGSIGVGDQLNSVLLSGLLRETDERLALKSIFAPGIGEITEKAPRWGREGSGRPGSGALLGLDPGGLNEFMDMTPKEAAKWGQGGGYKFMKYWQDAYLDLARQNGLSMILGDAMGGNAGRNIGILDRPGLTDLLAPYIKEISPEDWRAKQEYRGGLKEPGEGYGRGSFLDAPDSEIRKLAGKAFNAQMIAPIDNEFFNVTSTKGGARRRELGGEFLYTGQEFQEKALRNLTERPRGIGGVKMKGRKGIAGLAGMLGLQQGGFVPRFHSGGIVPNFGKEQLALLKGGEAILNQKAVSDIGSSSINAMNMGGMVPNFGLDADLEKLIYSRVDFSNQDDALKFLRGNLFDEAFTSDMLKKLAYGAKLGGEWDEAFTNKQIKPLGRSKISVAGVGEGLAGKFHFGAGSTASPGTGSSPLGRAATYPAYPTVEGIKAHKTWGGSGKFAGGGMSIMDAIDSGSFSTRAMISQGDQLNSVLLSGLLREGDERLALKSIFATGIGEITEKAPKWGASLDASAPVHLRKTEAFLGLGMDTGEGGEKFMRYWQEAYKDLARSKGFNIGLGDVAGSSAASNMGILNRQGLEDLLMPHVQRMPGEDFGENFLNADDRKIRALAEEAFDRRLMAPIDNEFYNVRSARGNRAVYGQTSRMWQEGALRDLIGRSRGMGGMNLRGGGRKGIAGFFARLAGGQTGGFVPNMIDLKEVSAASGGGLAGMKAIRKLLRKLNKELGPMPRSVAAHHGNWAEAIEMIPAPENKFMHMGGNLGEANPRTMGIKLNEHLYEALVPGITKKKYSGFGTHTPGLTTHAQNLGMQFPGQGGNKQFTKTLWNTLRHEAKHLQQYDQTFDELKERGVRVETDVQGRPDKGYRRTFDAMGRFDAGHLASPDVIKKASNIPTSPSTDPLKAHLADAFDAPVATSLDDLKVRAGMTYKEWESAMEVTAYHRLKKEFPGFATMDFPPLPDGSMPAGRPAPLGVEGMQQQIRRHGQLGTPGFDWVKWYENDRLITELEARTKETKFLGHTFGSGKPGTIGAEFQSWYGGNRKPVISRTTNKAIPETDIRYRGKGLRPVSKGGRGRKGLAGLMTALTRSRGGMIPNFASAGTPLDPKAAEKFARDYGIDLSNFRDPKTELVPGNVSVKRDQLTGALQSGYMTWDEGSMSIDEFAKNYKNRLHTINDRGHHAVEGTPPSRRSIGPAFDEIPAGRASQIRPKKGTLDFDEKLLKEWVRDIQKMEPEIGGREAVKRADEAMATKRNLRPTKPSRTRGVKGRKGIAGLAGLLAAGGASGLTEGGMIPNFADDRIHGESVMEAALRRSRGAGKKAEMDKIRAQAKDNPEGGGFWGGVRGFTGSIASMLTDLADIGVLLAMIPLNIGKMFTNTVVGLVPGATDFFRDKFAGADPDWIGAQFMGIDFASWATDGAPWQDKLFNEGEFAFDSDDAKKQAKLGWGSRDDRFRGAAVHTKGGWGKALSSVLGSWVHADPTSGKGGIPFLEMFGGEGNQFTKKNQMKSDDRHTRMAGARRTSGWWMPGTKLRQSLGLYTWDDQMFYGRGIL